VFLVIAMLAGTLIPMMIDYQAATPPPVLDQRELAEPQKVG